MRVHVLHHATCFDGAASSAIFAAFYRQCLEPRAEFAYIPKAHCQGDPFDAADFEADETAIVDFRYSRHPRLGWFFDHHKSAFQLPGEREHFLRHRDGRRFHDATVPSCTGFIADVARRQFGFDPSPYGELLRWAEIIDSAAFPDPRMPVELRDPAMRLMTFVEHNADRGLTGPFIEDLGCTPLSRLATAAYVLAVVEPAIELLREDIELMRRRCQVQDGVAVYDLTDQPPRAYNKFIAYYLHPDIRYLVGLSLGPDGRLKLSAGYNPWLPAAERAFDIASLCERFDGGGHPFVGGVSFDPGDGEAAAQALDYIVATLRGKEMSSAHDGR